MSFTGEARIRRKLAVVLAADVAGYAAHIVADEEGTIRRFAALERIAEDIIVAHTGRIFNTAGDAFLAEFDSAVNAVRAALDVLEAAESLAHDAPPERELALRIGIAFGDVVVSDDGNLLGNSINVAARLQALTPAGTLCISREVQSLVRDKIAMTFKDLGEQHLKNISQPVHAYVVHASDAKESAPALKRGGRAAPLAAVLRSPWRRTNGRRASAVLTIGALMIGTLTISYALRTGLPALAPARGPDIAGCPVFPADNIWNRRVDLLPVHAKSSVFVNQIGADKSAHPDFGAPQNQNVASGIPFTVVPADQKKSELRFEAFGDEPHAGSESDSGPFPIPADAPIEGGAASNDDRHVIVVQQGTCTLFELYKARPHADGGWSAVSAARFDLTSNALRRLRHTSADGAGLPIFPGLVRYAEVAQGEIRHALRFTAPKTQRAFVWPARKFSSNDLNDTLPPMGQRFRLRANFDISGFSKENKVILTALKRYGMMLADNGSPWFITGTSDAGWNDTDLRDLKRLKGTDFEAVDVSSLMVDEASGAAHQK